MILSTNRLRLVAATPATARADLAGRDALQMALGVAVPENWPPQYYDAAAIATTLRWLEEDAGTADWAFYYIVRREPLREDLVVGIVGYKGKPSADGTVEIGYSVLAQHQRAGIATEAAGALVERAFADARVTRVIAETLPELLPSIGVLRKLGFRFVGTGSETGTIRYRLERTEYEKPPSHATGAPHPSGRFTRGDTNE